MPQKTILIIDDEEPIRVLLKLTLQSAGYDSVLEASNGEDGLALAMRYKPDLILLDLMLPGMDGLSVCRRLKSSPDTQMIPIIMLTAKSDESDIVIGLEMGANDYITTPIAFNIAIALGSMFAAATPPFSAITSVAHWFIIASFSMRLGAEMPYF